MILFHELLLSIVIETRRVLTLFPLLCGRWYEARMRNFMLPENASSAQSHGSPLVPLPAPSLFSWLAPLLSPILRGFTSGPQPAYIPLYFLLPHPLSRLSLPPLD